MNSLIFVAHLFKWLAGDHGSMIEYSKFNLIFSTAAHSSKRRIFITLRFLCVDRNLSYPSLEGRIIATQKDEEQKIQKEEREREHST